MRRVWRQGLSVFLSVLFLSPSLSGEPAELVGVAKASGRAEINGLIFPGESNVYSGDRVSTGQKSALTLFTAPQEKIYIAPGSSARLLKDNDANVVVLEQGSATFGTVGHTRLVIDRYDVMIRSRSDFPSIAQVTLFKGRGARVWALKGAVEVVGANQSVLLQTGQLALISDSTAREPLTLGSEGSFSPQAQQSTEAQPGSITGTVVDNTRAVVWRAAVLVTSRSGVLHTTETNQLGQFSFEGLSPGFYSLSITKKGLHSYQTGTVLVEPGRQSSLGVITVQRGMGGGKKTAIAIVVIGGAAAAVAIPLALGGKAQPVVSPTVP
jgi:hypothetical protein